MHAFLYPVMQMLCHTTHPVGRQAAWVMEQGRGVQQSTGSEWVKGGQHTPVAAVAAVAAVAVAAAVGAR